MGGRPEILLTLLIGDGRGPPAMRVKEVSDDDPAFPPTDASAAAPDEIALIEMANLPPERTGVEGVIYISTSQASHAPWVKWYPDRPRDKAPCLSVTVESAPRAFNHHLPTRVFEVASEQVKAWVALNRVSLLDFWDNGNSWMDDEVDAFKKTLQKLSKS